MKILVCVKQVPDTSGKVAVNPDGTRLDRAVAVTAVENGLCSRGADILVRLPGGELVVRYERDGQVWLTGDAVTDRHALLKGKSDSPAATFFPQRQKCIALTVDFLHAVKGAATKPDFVKGVGIAIMKFKELACKL